MIEVETLRRAADMVIRRACGFGAIAIATTMVGFAGQPGRALQCGAILFGIMAAILAIMAARAPRTPYRRTELWLMVKKAPPALPAERLQQLLGGVMAERFGWHARLAGGLAALMLVMGFAVRAVAA
jgi:hypothetical protein